ncbi:MAG: DUF1572 family protein [Aestuariibaculum sp.]
MDHFLSSSIKLFAYYKSLANKTFNQLTFEELQWQSSESSNSIAVITKHIAGNMKSRWTNFLIEDGEKPWRNRDMEFVDTYTTKENMIADWESAWHILFDTLTPLTSNDLDRIVYIRNEGHTITEAINRQTVHYAYHIGQIVFLGKLLKNDNWENLSIAKGKSGKYNNEKFNNPKENRHFTDNI